MKKLMLGNEAVARGLYEAGVRFISSYPGTPSTEITEYAAAYDEMYAEWAPNEKVAFESAFGAAIGGGRAFTAMKHVGLNVAADPLFVSSYTGINAGFVIGVADDPGMHSSQNEQDSRHYAQAAKLPMAEPSDSAECLEFVKLAYDLSEKYDIPFILRTSTRIAHSQSAVTLSDRVERPVLPYEKNAAKYVMMPANAKGRHTVLEGKLRELAEYAETSPLNKIEEGKDGKIGVITAGTSYIYAKEAFGDSVSYLKLGLVNPLPAEMIRKFAASVERLIVVEELDPVIETYVKSLGIECDGKNILPIEGEFSSELVKKAILGVSPECRKLDETMPPRPPVLCPGCPHRPVFYTLKKLGVTVIGDIGCYTLGAVAPLASVDTTLCMGASVSGLHGRNKVRGDESATVAVIGDSTFVHSGITGLINIVYNNGNSTVLILDNHITGMTGHQQNPCTGLTLKNDPAPALDLEKLCAAVGVPEDHIKVVDPNNMKELEATVKAELISGTPSVVICRRPCALLKSVPKKNPLKIDADACRGCKACMKIACPAISFIDGKAHIDSSLCTGCELCRQMCHFNAIC